MCFHAPSLLRRIPFIDDDLSGHGQSPGTSLALVLAGVRLQTAMTVGAIHLQRRGNSAIGICWPVLFRRASSLDFESAGLVEAGPLLAKIRHRLSLARYNVSDAELMGCVGGRPNRDVNYLRWQRICDSNNECVALVLMTDLIERAKKTDTRLDCDHLTPEGNPIRGQLWPRPRPPTSRAATFESLRQLGVCPRPLRVPRFEPKLPKILPKDHRLDLADITGLYFAKLILRHAKLLWPHP
jgi:hypothetical protein